MPRLARYTTSVALVFGSLAFWMLIARLALAEEAQVQEEQRRPFVYYGKCTRVVDGDTIDVELDLGFNLTYGLRIRLFGINAPEVRGSEREAGLQASDWLKAHIEGEQIKLETLKDKTGKYGRYLGIIYREYPPGHEARGGDLAAYVNLNDLMVERGHAVVQEY